MSPEQKAFEAGLDAKPDDWGLWAVYADWLEEVAGEGWLARAQRWMAENRKCPRSSAAAERARPEYGWCWDLENDNFQALKTAESSLPVPFGYSLLTWDEEKNRHCTRYYKNRRRAESALAEALYHAEG